VWLIGVPCPDYEVPPWEGTVSLIRVPCGDYAVPPCECEGDYGPYPDYQIDIYRDDGVTLAAQTSSDADGNYRIGLPPGDYIIDTPGKYFYEVTIVSKETTELDLCVDRGMRDGSPPVK